ncbi:ATP-binding cassette domain-containing protein, partial [Brucella neotomae]
MIELSNLDVVFGRGTPLEKQVLHKINLTMNKGSFVTVIGSNGAGKSTMLGVLAGDVIPTRGKVVIAGQDVTRNSTADRAGLVARVFQDPLAGSCGTLTIEEN